jgi:tRNA threonylcarbamoyladenosine biosynthesis protein TsaB
MIVLALDTAGPRPAAALGRDALLYEERLPDDRRASEALLPAVERLLAAARVRLADVDRIGVCAGPGSFTGLRVGLATAWAFGRAVGVDVETVSTLEVLAEAARASGATRIVCALDAGRGDLVLERFDLAAARARSLGPARLVPAGGAAAFAEGDPVLALPERAGISTLPEPGTTLAAALVAAIRRQPGSAGVAQTAAIYSRPSAAEEKHGAP